MNHRTDSIFFTVLLKKEITYILTALFINLWVNEPIPLIGAWGKNATKKSKHALKIHDKVTKCAWFDYVGLIRLSRSEMWMWNKMKSADCGITFTSYLFLSAVCSVECYNQSHVFLLSSSQSEALWCVTVECTRSCDFSPHNKQLNADEICK